MHLSCLPRSMESGLNIFYFWPKYPLCLFVSELSIIFVLLSDVISKVIYFADILRKIFFCSHKFQNINLLFFFNFLQLVVIVLIRRELEQLFSKMIWIISCIYNRQSLKKIISDGLMFREREKGCTSLGESLSKEGVKAPLDRNSSNFFLGVL